MASAKTLVCILGPTAVGKTALAIRVAKALHTEIISADSRQFYKEISIGTAKPAAAELAEVPHHFIGHLSINQTYSAGDFEREAIAKLNELFEIHDVVVAVGGSGLYVKALIEGLDDMPGADEVLRKELNTLFELEGITALQNKLLTIDAELHQQTETLNPQRIMRAIEVALAYQQGFKPRFTKQPRNFNTLNVVLNLPREQLYQRINQRVDMMMEAGLLEEVKSVLSARNEYALQTVGYTEMFDYLDGKHDLETAINLIKQHTRNFAKRQLTWFKKEAPQYWFTPDECDAIVNLYQNTIQQHLK
jgi:tRNA dimethylallyltransferase